MPVERKTAQETVAQRLQILGIKQHETLGQHFLINDAAIAKIGAQVNPGARVIEVGSGVGQVTDILADRADSVLSLEIDTRYAPVLDKLAQERPNVQIVYGDALNFPWQKYSSPNKDQEPDLQVIANLPYHISEPFMRKLVTLKIDSAVLLLGQKLVAEASAAHPDSMDFGTLTLLTQSFFTMERLAELPRDNFIPPPRTESALVKFTPRDERFDPLSRRDHVFRALFLSEKKNPSLASVLKDELIAYENKSNGKIQGKREKVRTSRRQTKIDLRRLVYEYESVDNRQDAELENGLINGQRRVMDWVRQAGVTEAMLHKPFRQLDNTEIRKLAIALS